MENQENSIKKVCSFYVNKWHLTTMILPHINKSLKEKTKNITILEEGIKENIKILISRMNLKEETKNQIEKINWTNTQIYKYTEIEKYLIENIKNETNINIIINGKNKYIDIVNSNIDKFIKKNKTILNNKNITIINCYEIAQFRNISEITNKHDMILNTSGIRAIEEVFTSHSKNELQNTAL